MELTPQERQRIYEEEKARLAAKQQLETKRNAYGCLGCLGVITVIGIVFALTSIGEKRDSSTSGREKTGSTPRSILTDGDIGRIVATAPCATTKDALDELSKWAGLGDREEFVRTMIRTGSSVAEQGSRAKILDRGIIRTKVRLLDSGAECWISAEMVR